MNDTLGFKDIAEVTEPFEPSYTEEFKSYMEKSIRESILNAAKAWKKAKDIIINV